MWVLSDEEKKEREESLLKKLNDMTKKSKVSVDMSSQEKYIINKKILLVDLRNTLAKIDNLVRTGAYKEMIISDDIVKISRLIDKVDTKLWEIEDSLEDEYEGLLLSSQWMEDNITH
jgi:hypothetical protein